MNGIGFIRAVALICGVTVKETSKEFKSPATSIIVALGNVTLKWLGTFKTLSSRKSRRAILLT